MHETFISEQWFVWNSRVHNVFEWDGAVEPWARWMGLPDIVTGSFLVRYVSNCQLSSTYENISFTLLSHLISLRHIALN